MKPRARVLPVLDVQQALLATHAAGAERVIATVTPATPRAAMPHPAHEDMELSVCFNPLLAPEQVGGKLLQLARVANAV